MSWLPVGCFSVPNGRQADDPADREARVTIATLQFVGGTTKYSGGGASDGRDRGVRMVTTCRMVTGAVDGRGMQPSQRHRQAEAIEHWRQSQRDGALDSSGTRTAWLVAKHG